MQRDIGHVVADDAGGFGHQRGAFGAVKLGRDLGQHGVEGRVGIATRVQPAFGLGAGSGHVGKQGVGVRHRKAGVADHVERDVLGVQAHVPLGHGFDLRCDLDVHAAQHGDDGQADLLVVHIAVVRALHTDREPVRVTGLRQQFLRGFGVERQQTRVEVLGRAVELR